MNIKKNCFYNVFYVIFKSKTLYYDSTKTELDQINFSIENIGIPYNQINII